MSDPQRVLVTGGSSGIGEGVCERLGSEGARVGVGYHSGGERAEEVAEEVRKRGGKAVPIEGNVSDEASVDAAFEAMEKAFGGIDAVVVNAGVQADAPIEKMTFEVWRRVMAVDLDGAFLCARAGIRYFQRRTRKAGKPRGKLCFVSSVHEFIPWACHANYAAAKGGVEMLMKSLAQEVAGDGIRVNGVAPGAIKTPINADVWRDKTKRDALLELIPYGRLGDPSDVAAAVSWLLSDDSDYVTGVTLTVDGGMSLYPGFIGNG